MKPDDSCLKHLGVNIFVCLFCVTCTCLRADEPTQRVTYADRRLDNGIVSVVFDHAQGSFSILDAQSGEVLLSEAQFGLPSGNPGGAARLMTVCSKCFDPAKA